jgi:hypothetical protein
MSGLMLRSSAAQGLGGLGDRRRDHRPDQAPPSTPRDSEGSSTLRPEPAAYWCVCDHVSRPAQSDWPHRSRFRKIAKNSLRIGPMEAIDGTPVIDIKPVLCEVQRGKTVPT